MKKSGIHNALSNAFYALRGALGSDRGSVTIEGAIIIQIVIFAIGLAVYINLIFFEQAQMQTSAGYAAHRVSSIWRDDGLYRRWIDPDKSKKEILASDTAVLRNHAIKLPNYYSYAGGESKFKNDIFVSTLNVRMRGSITMPHKQTMKVFGFSNKLNADFNSKSVLPDFAENIRVISYVTEIIDCLEETSPELAKATGEFSDFLGKIKSKIGGLL